MCVMLKEIQEKSTDFNEYRTQLENLVEHFDQELSVMKQLCLVLSREANTGYWITNELNYIINANDMFLKFFDNYAGNKTIYDLLISNQFIIKQRIGDELIVEKLGRVYRLKSYQTPDGEHFGTVKDITDQQLIVDRLVKLKRELSQQD